jgi:hypothetical protein
MDTPPVRTDIWVCGGCGTSNTIALAPEQCPSCSHVRDFGISCCSNPGDYLQATGLFPGHPQYQDEDSLYPTTGYHAHGGVVDSHADDMWTCENCGAQNPSWHTFCPICPSPNNSMQYSISRGPAFSDGGAGSTADGVWICANPNCQSSNASFHWPQCGACGYVHPN